MSETKEEKREGKKIKMVDTSAVGFFLFLFACDRANYYFWYLFQLAPPTATRVSSFAWSSSELNLLSSPSGLESKIFDQLLSSPRGQRKITHIDNLPTTSDLVIQLFLNPRHNSDISNLFDLV